MRIRAVWPVVLLLPVVAALACSDDTEDNFAYVVDAGTSAPTPGPGDASAADDDDAGEQLTGGQVLHVVKTINDGEIAEATLAQQKATTTGARDYAEHMISDHGTANQRLTTLAQQKGLVLTDNPVSQQLKAAADAMATAAAALSGSAFDEKYIADQVAMHQSALTVIDQRLLPSTTDADMRAELTTTRASVAMHLTHAQELAAQLADGGTDAGEDSGMSMH